MEGYYVYILASGRNGTLYVGVTNDIARRIAEHRAGVGDGFTKKYRVGTLVHIERYAEIQEAKARERAMKKWRRVWKLQLIEKDNPSWTDLYERINA